jgi:acyl phosphate:glycerol-3-phosphate acyltransferase
MDFLQIILCTTAAYLIGSIPVSILISKFFYGIDIRDHGNGMATHDNLEHVIGMKPGMVARILDIAKGLIAARVVLFAHKHYGIFESEETILLIMTFGLAAVLGHVYPIFAGYRGGKGYHCMLGVLLAVDPVASSISVAISLLIFFLSKYPHLGYVAGAFVLPFFFWMTRNHRGDMTVPMLIFGSLLFFTLLFTYRENLVGILMGTEAKTKRFWLRLPRNLT